jgi:hypothetical protein
MQDMFDKIEKKVHEIQRQPEHIRLRWVWGSVIVAMIFVLFIWVMSMRISFLDVNTATQPRESISDIQDRFNNITGPMPTEQPVSIDDLIETGAIEQ